MQYAPIASPSSRSGIIHFLRLSVVGAGSPSKISALCRRARSAIAGFAAQTSATRSRSGTISGGPPTCA